jgi:DNA-binding XRE family transcriptional regulator
MAVKEISDQDKQKWIDLIQEISVRRVHLFTLSELAVYLNVSRKTIIDFEHGRIYDGGLLFSYAAICGYDIEFKLSTL